MMLTTSDFREAVHALRRGSVVNYTGPEKERFYATVLAIRDKRGAKVPR